MGPDVPWNLLIMGILWDWGGMMSATMSRKNTRPNRTVTLRDTFSPQSGGSMNAINADSCKEYARDNDLSWLFTVPLCSLYEQINKICQLAVGLAQLMIGYFVNEVARSSKCTYSSIWISSHSCLTIYDSTWRFVLVSRYINNAFTRKWNVLSDMLTNWFQTNFTPMILSNSFV